MEALQASMLLHMKRCACYLRISMYSIWRAGS